MPIHKVQTVIRSYLESKRTFEPRHRPQDTHNSLEAGRRDAGIVGMTRGADLVLVADRDHAVEKIGDALPGRFFRDPSGARQLVGVLGLGQLPGAIAATAPAGCCSGSQHAEQAHVVFEGRDLGRGAGRDHFLDVLDVAIAPSGSAASMIAPRRSWSMWLDERNGRATMSSETP